MRPGQSPKLPPAWGWLMPALIALALGCLGWQAWRVPKIQFLPPGAAPWIVYPSPVRTHTLEVRFLPAEFHGQIVLERKPTKAMLDWRCFRHGRLTINGQVVSIPESANWKVPAGLEVAALLRAGTNEVVATVWADTGPPALSLRLQTDETTVVTDEHWDVSLAGARRLPANGAGAIVEPQAGNPLFGNESTRAAWAKTLGLESVFLAISALAALLWWRFRARLEDGGRKERWLRNLALAGIAMVWLALLAHNIGCLAVRCGFDSAAHLDYIKYIQTNRSLPLANQGLEMFQAPLYYVISAGLLSALHHTTDLDGLRILRVFHLFVGAANAALVWFGLGLIYPGQWKKPLAGAALAAFAPWQLYLLHYPTNEVLCGALGTAALCLALKCLTFDKDVWRPGWLAALGAALGVGCLTKASALVLLPVVFIALAGQLIAHKQRSALFWLKVMGLVFGVALAIGVWPYWRAWRHFGDPLLGGWSGETGTAPWWQQPGFVTPAYFDSFGRALVSPYFCGLHGFWDGLYSTLWGDGLCGGADKMALAPPWNYDCMTTGYILALVPSLLLVSGAVVTLIEFARKPQTQWLLLGGVAVALLLALAHMNLKLPYLACAKSFFALAAMLPFCAFIVAGFAFWRMRLGAVAGYGLLALLGLWFINDFTAFWIKPDAPHTKLLVARQKFMLGKEDAAPDLERLLQSDPGNRLAAEYLALAELKAGRTNRFEAVVTEAAKNGAVDGELALLATKNMLRQGHFAEALAWARKAAQGAPDDEIIGETWLDLASASKENSEIIAAGEWFLRNDPGSLSAHKMMAEALNRVGETNAAAMHLSIGRATSF